MGKGLRHVLSWLWRRSRRGLNERRAAKARARFWAEVREGQSEAAARSRRSAADSAGSRV